MNPKTINAIRDCAIKHEKVDIFVAYELMKLAHQLRPSGPLIKRKYNEYREKLHNTTKLESVIPKEPAQESVAREELKKLIENGEVCIIPIGFRCYTSMNIKKKLGITQASLPFNSGFFPPSSISSILRNPKINLKANDNGASHTVCIKTENNIEISHGKGIKFKSSSYHEINKKASHKTQKGINSLLDSTFGYYTLDKNHNYILAHYNWHSFANKKHSNGVADPEYNLKIINETLNKRISRMFELCKSAKHIYFITYEHQGYKYMRVDDTYYKLDDFSELNSVCTDLFGKKFSILDIKNIHGAIDLIKDIKCRNNQKD